MPTGSFDPIKQVFVVIFNIESLKHLKIFLLEGPPGVVLLLVLNIRDHPCEV